MTEDAGPGEGPVTPPPARRRGSSRPALLPSLLGVVIALAAAAVYYFFFVYQPPAPPGPKAVARLTAVEGPVRLKIGGLGQWREARVRRMLRSGDVVQTDPKAGAEITFLSGNVVRVRPDSVVLISEGTAEVAEEATSWQVQSGQVNFEVKQNTDIVTPTARTRAVANSTGNIDVDDEGGTGVKIFTGSAEVATTAGQKVTLADNQAVLVDAKGQAGPRIELPPAPVLVAPPADTEVPFVTPPETTAQLAWRVVKGAATYRVSMDYNVVQANLLLSAALEEPNIPSTSHELSGLDPGRYYWRVAGVSQEGLEGDYSKVSLFSVVRPPEPSAPPSAAPRLVVQAADLESVLEVKGRTEPGAEVTVDGYAVRVLPDGTFNEFVRKTGQTFVVVKATTPDGQVTEEKRPVSRR